MQTLWAEFTEPKVSEDGRLRHKLYQLGKWVHGEFGEFDLTEKLHQEMVRNFEPVNLDYNHVWDDVSAGKIVEIEPDLDPEGWAWGTSVLTPNAIGFVNTGEYRGFSPEIEFKSKDRKGKPIGCYLAAGGLTNRPFFPIELAAIRRDRLAASRKAGFSAPNTEATMLELMGRMDAATGMVYATLPSGTTLPDGTALTADTEVEIKMAEAEMAKRKDEMAQMTAKINATNTENAALKASLGAVNKQVETLQASIKGLEDKAEAERLKRVTTEAELFASSRHVKPSLIKRVVATFVAQGKDEAEALLTDIGDSAYIPTGELGSGANPNESGADAFENAVRQFCKDNPKAKESEAIAALKLTMPTQHEAWDRRGWTN